MTQDPQERAAVDPEAAAEDVRTDQAQEEPGLEAPEADAAEQRRMLEDEETEEPEGPLPPEVSEGDLLDQHRAVPAPEQDNYGE